MAENPFEWMTIGGASKQTLLFFGTWQQSWLLHYYPCFFIIDINLTELLLSVDIQYCTSIILAKTSDVCLFFHGWRDHSPYSRPETNKTTVNSWVTTSNYKDKDKNLCKFGGYLSHNRQLQKQRQRHKTQDTDKDKDKDKDLCEFRGNLSDNRQLQRQR